MSDETRDKGEAMRRGLRGRCPSCGKGALFQGYLAVVPGCSACGEPLERYRAADGPAFITITIVGLLLIPILGWGFVVFRPNGLTLAIWATVLLTVMTLVVLRLSKGAFVGYLWAMHEVDRGA